MATGGQAPVVGILLAAGRGRRFDPTGLRKKLLQALPASDGAGGDATFIDRPGHAMPGHEGPGHDGPGHEGPGRAGPGNDMPVNDPARQPVTADDKSGRALTVVAASAAHLLQVLPTVLAVVRPGDEDVADALRAAGCTVLRCADADDGMAASLACALRAAPRACGWVVALGDMPYVAPSTVQALADAVRSGATLAAPVMDGRRGNPVGFAASLLPELLALRGEEGARRLFGRHAFTAIAVDDPGVLRDIDLPADLQPLTRP